MEILNLAYIGVGLVYLVVAGAGVYALFLGEKSKIKEMLPNKYLVPAAGLLTGLFGALYMTSALLVVSENTSVEVSGSSGVGAGLPIGGTLGCTDLLVDGDVTVIECTLDYGKATNIQWLVNGELQQSDGDTFVGKFDTRQDSEVTVRYSESGVIAGRQASISFAVGPNGDREVLP